MNKQKKWYKYVIVGKENTKYTYVYITERDIENCNKWLIKEKGTYKFILEKPNKEWLDKYGSLEQNKTEETIFDWLEETFGD